MGNCASSPPVLEGTWDLGSCAAPHPVNQSLGIITAAAGQVAPGEASALTLSSVTTEARAVGPSTPGKHSRTSAQSARGSADSVGIDMAITLSRESVPYPSANLLQLGADAMPLSVTICNTEDLQVVYQNHSSLAYAGDQRGVSQLSGASRSFLMQLLSLQPPEMVEEVMAALDKGEGPWIRVIQVPSRLEADQDVTTPTSATYRAMPVGSPSNTMTERLGPTGNSFAADDFGFNTFSLSGGPNGAIDSILASKPSLATMSTKSVDRPRTHKERRPSSWLAQQLAPSTTPSGEGGRRNSSMPLPSVLFGQQGMIPLDSSLTTTINTSITDTDNNLKIETSLSYTGLPAASSPSTTNTRNRLAKLLCTTNSESDSGAAEGARKSDIRADSNLRKPPQAGGSATAGTSSDIKAGPCWHEVTITPFTNPGADQKFFIVAQAEVTARCQLEQHLMKMMEAQLFMLESMFPRHVLERMANMGTCGQPNTAAHAELGSTPLTPVPLQPHEMAPLCKGMGQMTHYHECVTIMFTDICGFTTMSERVEPQQVMTFLNSLFSKFDELVIKHKVSKVETAGDCFIIVGGLMEEDDDGFNALADNQSVSHARAAKRALNFAAEMLHVASTFTMPDGQPVRQRVGLHTGPVVSGLIGNLLPKFSLFGDTMNTASRMESTSIPGRIQVSEATYKLLQDAPECWECTGGVEVKGKGMMSTYLLRESAVLTTGAFPCSMDVSAYPNPSRRFPTPHECTGGNHADDRVPCNIDMDAGGAPLRLPFAALESVSRASFNRNAHANRHAPPVEEYRLSPFPICAAHLLSRFSNVMQARFSRAQGPELVDITAALPSVPQLAHMSSLVESLLDTQNHMGLLISAMMSNSSGRAPHADSEGGHFTSGANAGPSSRAICSGINFTSGAHASHGNRALNSGYFASDAFASLNGRVLRSNHHASGSNAITSPPLVVSAKPTGFRFPVSIHDHWRE